MSKSVRLIIGGIAVLYLICLGAHFVTPDATLVDSKAFGTAVLLFTALAVTFHVAVAVLLGSWRATLLSAASMILLGCLLLGRLMILTGDTL